MIFETRRAAREGGDGSTRTRLSFSKQRLMESEETVLSRAASVEKVRSGFELSTFLEISYSIFR